ncbi:MAG: hypothetical protein ACLUTU_17570 [Blautia faecis]
MKMIVAARQKLGNRKETMSFCVSIPADMKMFRTGDHRQGSV